MIGLCRKAKRLSAGHDACMSAIIKESAKLCLLLSDASERLKREFEKAATYNGRQLEVIRLAMSMDELKRILGFRAGVLTINDEGFAKKIRELSV